MTYSLYVTTSTDLRRQFIFAFMAARLALTRSEGTYFFGEEFEEGNMPSLLTSVMLYLEERESNPTVLDNVDTNAYVTNFLNFMMEYKGTKPTYKSANGCRVFRRDGEHPITEFTLTDNFFKLTLNVGKDMRATLGPLRVSKDSLGNSLWHFWDSNRFTSPCYVIFLALAEIAGSLKGYDCKPQGAEHAIVTVIPGDIHEFLKAQMPPNEFRKTFSLNSE